MSDDKKNIYRVKKQNNYTIIDNTGPQDKRLSWGAKGLLVYMLTMPDDWTFYRTDLIKHSTDTMYKLKIFLKELKDLSYLTKAAIRDPDTKKIIGWETHIYEQPLEGEAKEKAKNQDAEYRTDGSQSLLSEKPESGKTRHLENQMPGNRPLQRTDELITDDTNIPIRADKLPDILKPTAILFIHQIGIKDITDDDFMCLRMLNKLHTPAAIQKEIQTAIKRLHKNGSLKLEQPDGETMEIKQLQDIPFRYIYNSMRNWTSRKGGAPGGTVQRSGSSHAATGRENKDYTKGSSEFFA